MFLLSFPGDLMEAVLTMRHISKSFFGVPADDDIDFDVRKGEIHALLGENGAGKTTLMNILYGIYEADGGEILWKGGRAEFRSPRDAIERGIGMVHQHFTLVGRLTVSENITLGLKSRGYPFTDRAYLDKKLEEISARYGLPIEPGKRISELSVGEQQRVEIMKLLYREAELLILDEPTAVLTPGETEEFFRVLRRLRSDGRSVIIITHRIPEVMEIADRVTVLRDGRKVCTEEIGNVTEEKLSSYMIGRQLRHIERQAAAAGGIGFSIRGLSMEEGGIPLISDLSLDIAEGEILGIAGVDGNGQKPLAEAIVGIRQYGSGTMSLRSASLDGMSVEERKRLGIGYISDDRHHDGLIMDMSLEENMLLRSDRSGFIRKGFIDFQKLRKETERTVERFAIKTHSVDMPVRLLSGGNQQKLILGREIYSGVHLVIAFQPTRGLDIGASESVRELLLSYRSQGCSVLLISADLEEIFSISDRIAVMHGGRIMGTVSNDGHADMTEIGLMMAGKEMNA